MIKAMLFTIGAFFWQGLVVQQTLRAFSSPMHQRRRRMTFGNAMWAVVALGALSAVIGGLGYLGIGVWILGWLFYLLVHMIIFSGYFGLAPQWALVLLPIIWLARVSFEWLLRLLPF